LGTVNIFLGGTGKYVASLEAGRAKIYGRDMSQSVVLDVDPEIVLSGPFSI